MYSFLCRNHRQNPLHLPYVQYHIFDVYCKMRESCNYLLKLCNTSVHAHIYLYTVVKINSQRKN